jgi:hypothetical protein
VTATILPHAVHYSEFAGGFNGTCTQTALDICMGIASGKDSTQASMVSITKDMIGKKLAAANGAATVKAVAEYARLAGHTIDTEWDFGAMGDWHQKLKTLAGHKPILLQIANGQALKDVETGATDEAGLHYHAIAVVGYQDDGYVCADGDNPDVSKRFQVYSYTVLAAAQPCGLLILNMVPPPKPPIIAPLDLPKGAAMQGDALAWNGFSIGGDFLTWCEDHHFSLGKPLKDAWAEGDHVYQTFDFGELRHSPQDGTFQANIGADLVKLRAILTKIKGELAT